MGKEDPESPAPSSRGERHWGRSRAQVQNITSAHTSHSEDMHRRIVKYSIAMGIRMVCLLALFFVDGLWKLIPVAGAVFLPWFAVIIANGGGDTAQPDHHALLTQAPQHEITEDDAAESTVTDPENAAAQAVLQGEIVPEDEDTAEPAGTASTEQASGRDPRESHSPHGSPA